MDRVRLFIILFTLSCSTFWKLLPAKYRDEKEGDKYTVGFQFDDIRIRVDTYVWMLGEHLVLVGMAVVIFMQETIYRKAFSFFLLLQIADTVGWALFYDDPLKDFIITFNILKIALFGLAIVNEINPLWRMKK